ncbi:MAG TPA: hypothetical protein VFI47_26220 [Acidimicrobiales bacterium]|nr:hypothetical protein [Acidimicrobiales bacterium]
MTDRWDPNAGALPPQHGWGPPGQWAPQDQWAPPGPAQWAPPGQGEPPKRGPSAEMIVIMALTFVTVVAIAVAVVTVRRDDGPGTTTAAPDVQLADLTPALLTLDDVGEDFKTPEESNPTPFVIPDGATSAECVEVGNALIGGPGGNVVRARFEHTGMASIVGHSMTMTADGDPTVDDYVTVLRTCPTIEVDAEGYHDELTLEVDRLDDLGSDAAAVAMHVDTVDPQGTEVSGDVYYVIWQRGPVTSKVTQNLFDSLDQHPPIDRMWVRGLADTADGRLEGALAG